METKIQNISITTTLSKKLELTEEYRQKYGTNTIVLFKRGNRYVAYEECADALSKATGITLDKRAGIRYAEFPRTAEDVFFAKCIRKGFKLCIIE